MTEERNWDLVVEERKTREQAIFDQLIDELKKRVGGEDDDSAGKGVIASMILHLMEHKKEVLDRAIFAELELCKD